MNEFEKLKIDDKTVKAFSCMTKRLWDSLTRFQKQLETQSPGSDADADVDTNAEVIDSTIAPWNITNIILPLSFLSFWNFLYFSTCGIPIAVNIHLIMAQGSHS